MQFDEQIYLNNIFKTNAIQENSVLGLKMKFLFGLNMSYPLKNDVWPKKT